MAAILAVATPALMPGDSNDYRSANNSEPATIGTRLVEVGLDNAPDTVLPLRELGGPDLPELRLSDLYSASPIETAPGRTPAGIQFVAERNAPAADPNAPAPAPGVVPPELMNEVGAHVKELIRDTPFSVVALTAEDLTNTTAMIRARRPDGTWGPWYQAEPIEEQGTAAAGGTQGTEPIYVGNTEAVQILVTRKKTDPPADPAVQPVTTVHPVDKAASGLTAVLIDPGRGAGDADLDSIAAELPNGGPRVITRGQWGADESLRCQAPTYDDGLGGVTIHHTAGRNDYSKAESAGIVRAIYTYHAQTLGWCDIGYHALIDKYGQIFEGRYGGLDQPVQGAHAGGFNQNTSGVALMGNYQSETPSEASIEAAGRFVGWRTKIAGLDPQGHTTMYSEGTQFTPYAQGEEVKLPIVFAHRDVGNTSCPGDAAYAQMDRIRAIAAETAGSGRPEQHRRPSRPEIAALAALTAKLLAMARDNLVAEYWVSTGGPDGPLGQAASEPMPAAQGQQYAKFVNGYVYTAPDGSAHEVAGKILDRFLELGADTGALGLPLSNTYPVPDGQRLDFQNGSLILNELTGIVTTAWKTYNETHPHQTQGDTAADLGGAPAPGPGSPVQDTAPAPETPAPATLPPSVPEPDRAAGTTPDPGNGTAPNAAPGSASAPETDPTPNQAPAFAHEPGFSAPAAPETTQEPLGDGSGQGLSTSEQAPAAEPSPTGVPAQAEPEPAPAG
ncbi:N-acetylmuramoyl-L-alanine amidase [Nocardia brevicatena]|uniref:N-acetylmuramoyl-L-alanine amidase n=1 Tax=Nocardia brevicatena TaxID=37327 RepID=UPI001FE15ED6|nr:N-acetylmuramoyl-L-alanine amidase [Nocardia brevicatena]